MLISFRFFVPAGASAFEFDKIGGSGQGNYLIRQEVQCMY